MHYFIAILLIFSAIPLPQAAHQAQPADCPVPLVETEDNIGFQAQLVNGHLIYAVEDFMATPPSQVFYTVPLDGRAAPALLHDAADNTAQTWSYSLSPDGDYAVMISNQGEAWVVPTSGGEPVTHFALNTGEIFHALPAYGQQGETLAFMTQDANDQRRLYIMPFPAGEPALAAEQVMRSQFFVHDDTTLLYVGQTDAGTPAIFRHALLSPDERTLLSGDLDVSPLLATNVPLVFLLAGDHLLFEASAADESGKALYAADLAGESLNLLHTSTPGFTIEGVVSPDNRTLAFEQNGELFTVPVDGSTPPVFIAEIYPGPTLQFTPDSQFITYVGQALPVPGQLLRSAVTGGEPISYEADIPFSWNYRLHPGDAYLAIEDAHPGSDQFAAYSLPKDSDGPLELLFESVWDFKSGPFVLYQEGSDQIIFRRYDGTSSSLYQGQMGESFTPVEIGCSHTGHIRLVGLHDNTVIYIADDNKIYGIPVE